MGKKDKTLSVKITDEEFLALQKLADQDSRTVSSLVRLLIINVISGNINISSNVQQK